MRADNPDTGDDHDDETAPAVSARLERGMIVAGALTSLILVAGTVIWGYRLAVRDVEGVPVIRAMDTPSRVAPEVPGGSVTEHQGLSVNEVAATGIAGTAPETMRLAPRPTELQPEDVAGLSPLASPEEAVAAAVGPALEDAGVLLGDAALTDASARVPDVSRGAASLATTTEDAIALALAEALGDGLDDAGAAVGASDAPVIRPQMRPLRILATEVALEASEPVDVVEMSLAEVSAGTRLVQLGTFETEDAARTAYGRLAERYADLMDGKAMVLEEATSGGRAFVRLRAHGFADETAARQFCSTFLLENVPCVPVLYR